MTRLQRLLSGGGGGPHILVHWVTRRRSHATLAMTVVDWTWHVYMQKLATSTVPLSFVDTLSCLANDAAAFAKVFTCVQCFAEVWGLEVDQDKTFAWGLSARSRGTLKDLGGLLCQQRRAVEFA